MFQLAILILALGLLAAACDRSSDAETTPVTTAPPMTQGTGPANLPEPTFYAHTGGEASEHVIRVYHSPSCGCCYKWVDHLRDHGFDIEEYLIQDMRTIKMQHQLPPSLGSCHTAVVDGYVVEGHVPADIIHRLLKERPDIAGIAVPGMPMGSPGMEGAYSEAYDVIAFDLNGKTSVYESVIP